MFKRALFAALAFVIASSAIAAETFDQQLKDVERIRSLTFVHAVRTRSITREELPRYLHEQFEKSLPTSFDDYMLVLTTLRFVDPAAKNPEKSLIDLMQQQVLAFYDPMTHVYFAIDKLPDGVPAGAAGLNLEDAVAVHELTHALQDQRFSIGRQDFATRKDTDANLALHALVEGEASLVMLAKMVEPLGQSLDAIVQNDTMLNAMSAAATMSASGANDTPRYFVDSLVIPYTAGMKFVAAAYRRGGWAAVNRVYDSPPKSMREVLHPDEYFAGQRTANAFSLTEPLPVSHLLTVEHLGEWHWQFLVGDAARGWKGDRVTIAQDAFCNPTALVETKWESAERADAFRTAYADFLKKQNIDAQIRTLSGNEVDVAYGADYALIERFMTR